MRWPWKGTSEEELREDRKQALHSFHADLHFFVCRLSPRKKVVRRHVWILIASFQLSGEITLRMPTPPCFAWFKMALGQTGRTTVFPTRLRGALIFQRALIAFVEVSTSIGSLQKGLRRMLMSPHPWAADGESGVIIICETPQET